MKARVRKAGPDAGSNHKPTAAWDLSKLGARVRKLKRGGQRMARKGRVLKMRAQWRLGGGKPRA